MLPRRPEPTSVLMLVCLQRSSLTLDGRSAHGPCIVYETGRRLGADPPVSSSGSLLHRSLTVIFRLPALDKHGELLPNGRYSIRGERRVRRRREIRNAFSVEEGTGCAGGDGEVDVLRHIAGFAGDRECVELRHDHANHVAGRVQRRGRRYCPVGRGL